MPDPAPSPGIKRLQKSLLRAARAGLSAGFAVISGDLAVMLVPRQYAYLAFAVVGGTMIVAYWWCFGRIFKNVGLTVK
jgi:uncharacterized membrane protein YgdD (TMEM256/DUF423 family)